MGSARFLVFAVFFLSVSAALGLQVILDIPRLRGTYVLILGIVAMDLGSTTFRQPYFFRSDLDWLSLSEESLDELMAYQTNLPPNQFVPGRLLHTNSTVNNYLSKLA